MQDFLEMNGIYNFLCIFETAYENDTGSGENAEGGSHSLTAGFIDEHQ